MGARHKGRAAALCMLYQADLSGAPADEVVDATLQGSLLDEPLEATSRQFAESLFRSILCERDRLDELIRAGSDNWRIERMAAVDRNVLRLALWELAENPTLSPAVVLDEAVELAKFYGGEESGAFVNGVLDGIRKRLESGELVLKR
jgi:N utilization substance protein B